MIFLSFPPGQEHLEERQVVRVRKRLIVISPGIALVFVFEFRRILRDCVVVDPGRAVLLYSTRQPRFTFFFSYPFTMF